MVSRICSKLNMWQVEYVVRTCDTNPMWIQALFPSFIRSVSTRWLILTHRGKHVHASSIHIHCYVWTRFVCYSGGSPKSLLTELHAPVCISERLWTRAGGRQPPVRALKVSLFVHCAGPVFHPSTKGNPLRHQQDHWGWQCMKKAMGMAHSHLIFFLLITFIFCPPHKQA